MKPTKDEKKRVIVALDVDSVAKAIALVEMLGPYVFCFKIGFEFITTMIIELIIAKNHTEARKVLGQIRKLFRLLGGNIFWDGKFADIPNTTGKAAAVLRKLGVKMFNSHASAGIESMKKAVAEKGDALALAVTVLTSIDNDESIRLFGASAAEQVVNFAYDAATAKKSGIVCSPEDLGRVNEHKDLVGLVKVTPSIRAKDAPPDDQKRTMTEEEAILAGADYLVIGRPITGAPDPVAAIKQFNINIEAALEKLAA